MAKRILILGASGSGTTTLAKALSKRLPQVFLDTDDYFFITKFSEPRPLQDRREMLIKDLDYYENWVLSGHVCGWGDGFKKYFDVVVFILLPHDVRMERLKQREYDRYGKEMFESGSRYEQSQAFLQWAALYDTAGLEVRSKALHEEWLSDLSCPVLRIDGDYTVKERVDIVLNYLNSPLVHATTEYKK